MKPLKIVTTVAMQGVIEKLTPEFTKATGLGVEMDFAPPSATVEKIRKGEAADVVIATPEGIDGLVKEGKLAAGTSRPVAKMIMGLAVGPNEPKPHISTPEQFKQALLDVRSLIHADPATGSPSAAHFIKVCQKLGIADEIKRKTVTRSGLVAPAAASGEVGMAVQQLAELLLVPGVHVLGPFPDELQNVMPLSAGVHAQSAAPQAAQAMIDLLAAPRTRAVVEQCGLLPA
ncbi:MAG: molybdate ABC transporter substrate-binding protein [Pseudolabrys sp.]